MKNPVPIAAALLSLTLTPALTAADTDHIVPLPELHQRAVTASQERQKNLAEMDRFLSAENVAQSLRSAKLNPRQIQNAVRMLSDADLARFADKARQVQSEFAAGALNNQELTYVIIALATAVLILIIVVA